MDDLAVDVAIFADEPEFPFDEAMYDLRLRHGVYLVLGELQTAVKLAHFGPVPVALDSSLLFQQAQHKDNVDVVLLDHPPELFDAVRHRALGGDYSLGCVR